MTKAKEEKTEAKPDTGPNVYQRLLAIMGEVTSIAKEDKRVNNQYQFVSHDAVTAALHGPCVKHGIYVHSSIVSYKHEGNKTEVMLAVTFVNADDPTQTVTSQFLGFGVDNSDKNPGKAVSYALKMALLKGFMLESGEPDNERSNVAASNGRKSNGSAPKVEPTAEELELYYQGLRYADNVDEMTKVSAKLAGIKLTDKERATLIEARDQRVQELSER